jgi:hypothetical protein
MMMMMKSSCCGGARNRAALLRWQSCRGRRAMRAQKPTQRQRKLWMPKRPRTSKRIINSENSIGGDSTPGSPSENICENNVTSEVQDALIRKATRWKPSPSYTPNPMYEREFNSIRVGCSFINLDVLDLYSFLHQTRYLTDEEFNSSGLSWSLVNEKWLVMIDKPNFDKSEICRRLFNGDAQSLAKKIRNLGFENHRSARKTGLSFYSYPGFEPNLPLDALEKVCNKLWKPSSPQSNSSSGNSSDETPSNVSNASSFDAGESPDLQQMQRLAPVSPTCHSNQCPPVPIPQIPEGWIMRPDGWVQHPLVIIRPAHNLWREHDYVPYCYQSDYWHYFPFSNKVRRFRGEVNNPSSFLSFSYHPSDNHED